MRGSSTAAQLLIEAHVSGGALLFIKKVLEAALQEELADSFEVALGKDAMYLLASLKGWLFSITSHVGCPGAQDQNTNGQNIHEDTRSTRSYKGKSTSALEHNGARRNRRRAAAAMASSSRSCPKRTKPLKS